MNEAHKGQDSRFSFAACHRASVETVPYDNLERGW